MSMVVPWLLSLARLMMFSAGQNKASGSEAALDCGAPYVDHNPTIQLRIKFENV